MGIAIEMLKMMISREAKTNEIGTDAVHKIRNVLALLTPEDDAVAKPWPDKAHEEVVKEMHEFSRRQMLEFQRRQLLRAHELFDDGKRWGAVLILRDLLPLQAARSTLVAL